MFLSLHFRFLAGYHPFSPRHPPVGFPPSSPANVHADSLPWAIQLDIRMYMYCTFQMLIHNFVQPKAIHKYPFTWLFSNRIKHKNNCGTQTHAYIYVSLNLNSIFSMWFGLPYQFSLPFARFFSTFATTEQQYNLCTCVSFRDKHKVNFLFPFSGILYSLVSVSVGDEFKI